MRSSVGLSAYTVARSRIARRKSGAVSNPLRKRPSITTSVAALISWKTPRNVSRSMLPLKLRTR